MPNWRSRRSFTSRPFLWTITSTLPPPREPTPGTSAPASARPRAAAGPAPAPAVVAARALFHVAALLGADHEHRPPVEGADAGDERAVVGAAAVAVQLDPVVEDARDIVERVRPVGMPRELDRPPDLLVGGVLLQPL